LVNMWLVVKHSLTHLRVYDEGTMCFDDDALYRSNKHKQRMCLTWSLMSCSVCECHSRWLFIVWTCLRINPDGELLSCGSCSLENVTQVIFPLCDATHAPALVCGV